MLSRSARPHLSFLKHQPAGAPGVRLASCLPPHNAGSPGMKDQVYSNSGLQLGGQDKDCRGSCDTLTCSRVNSPPSTLKIETRPVCLYTARFPIQLVVRLNTILFLPPFLQCLGGRLHGIQPSKAFGERFKTSKPRPCFLHTQQLIDAQRSFCSA